jgi:Domain of unknown function (DUF4440)
MRKQFTFLLLVLPFLLKSQQSNNTEIITKVKERDSLFWNSYNNCTTDLMAQYLTDDIEFYHDNGGITLGAVDLVNSIVKNICGNKEGKVRRALLTETSNIYLLKQGDAVYGAIFMGEHLFYITPLGQHEKLTGIAKFTNLWILKDGVWKMSRILSYDHSPISKLKKKKTKQ